MSGRQTETENKQAEIRGGRTDAADIENVLRILDGFAAGNESRMKLHVSAAQDAGTAKKVHHHGRCDIGSPWASGECFDAPEAECDIRD